VEDSSEFNFLRGSAFGKLITKIAIVKIRKRKEDKIFNDFEGS
jgi:hypothetical protein